MPALPPVSPEQSKADANHLQLLAIFHFVVAGLAVAGLGFIFAHYALMNFIFTNPEIWKNEKNPPPRELFAVIRWFYVFFGMLTVASGIGNLLSGLFIRKRKHRVFSLIIAGLDCFQFPFGTTLGIFTFVVLLRDSVGEIYAGNETTRPLS